MNIKLVNKEMKIMIICHHQTRILDSVSNNNTDNRKNIQQPISYKEDCYKNKMQPQHTEVKTL